MEGGAPAPGPNCSCADSKLQPNRVSGGVMCRLRSRGVCVLSALGAAALAASALPAQQDYPYSATLQFGTGLVNVPAAWISPRSGEIWIQTSGKQIPAGSGSTQLNAASEWNTNLSI